MLKINVNNFVARDFTNHSRLVVKKTGLYIETEKPNIFIRIWRFINRQYDKCKIAEVALNFFGHYVLQRDPQGTSFYHNLDVLIERISQKKSKCKAVHDQLHLRLLALREQSQQEAQIRLELEAQVQTVRETQARSEQMAQNLSEQISQLRIQLEDQTRVEQESLGYYFAEREVQARDEPTAQELEGLVGNQGQRNTSHQYPSTLFLFGANWLD